jgi:ribonuclease HI
MDIYQCHKVHLRRLRDMIWERAKAFEQITYVWVPREQNQDADDMSKSLQI